MKHARLALLSLAMLSLAMPSAAVPAQAGQQQSGSNERKPDTVTSDAPADNRLVPSEVSGDDCAADASIEVVPDGAMRSLHARLCEATVQPAHRADCSARAGSLRSIRFVTDHCAGSEEALEVSLGGRSYRLLRVGAAPGQGTPALAGTFSGDGLRLQVRPGRVIREHLDGDERIGVEQEIVVTLALDGATRILPAVYSDGP